MLNAIVFHWPNGFFWNRGGFEYPLFWTVAALFRFVRGGGPSSVDARLSKEL